MRNFSMRAIVMTGLVTGTMGLGGAALAVDLGEMGIAPLDPAGTQTGQAQRDGVEQVGRSIRLDRQATIAPLDPAGSQSGQTQRAPVTSLAPGGGPNPAADRFRNPAGTQSGP